MTEATIEGTIDARISADWLSRPSLQTLLAALSAEGEEARVVGGAVRNALLGQDIDDVDVATTTLPKETERRARTAGFRTVPTGIEHGTITVIADDRTYEVTTLREDVETDGRRAKVRFGRDFEHDAQRRDFTINALYATADGQIVDLVGGVADIASRTLRFIGDPEERIREDYLRILRFFRFFAWYGEGRPDAAGIRAATRLKDGLDSLSAERVWGELRKLLRAPDPSRALLWIRQTGVLTKVLPETERWGIDAIHGLMEAEAAFDWPADALLRLAAIVPPDAARLAAMAERLKMSNAERDRLVAFAEAASASDETSEAALRAGLYFGDRQAVVDRLKLAVAQARQSAAGKPEQLLAVAALIRQLKTAEAFAPPSFPLGGNDLRAAGVAPGRRMGEILQRLERDWVESGFALPRETLLERI